MLAAPRARRPPTSCAADDGEADAHDLWALVFEASRLDEIVEQVVRSLEFSVLAKYAFGLAQLFNAFYHRYPILNEERADRKRWRAAGVAYFRTQLTRALDLMGIEVPDPDVTDGRHDWRSPIVPRSSKTTGRRSCTSAARCASSIRR